MPLNQGRVVLAALPAQDAAGPGVQAGGARDSISLLSSYLEAMNRGDLNGAEQQLDAVEAAWTHEDADRLAHGESPLHHGRPRVYRLLLLEAQGRKTEALALARREIAALEALPGADDCPRLDRACLLEYVGDLDAAVALLNQVASGEGLGARRARSELTRIQAGLPPQL